jgi:hypothetical protein
VTRDRRRCGRLLTDHLLLGLEVDVEDRHGRLATAQGERDPGLTVDDEARALVHEDLLDPADLVERPREVLANPANWRIHPKAQQDASWSGASSPEPVIRLRHVAAVGGAVVVGWPQGGSSRHSGVLWHPWATVAEPGLLGWPPI